MLAAQSRIAGAASVSLERVDEQPIRQLVVVNGTVTSPQTALLSTSVGGLVENVLVEEGDSVAAGDVVVALDSELARLKMEQVSAEEAQAQAALEDANRRLREVERLGDDRAIAETEIKSLRTEVIRSEAQLRAAGAAERQQRAIVERHDIRAPFSGVVSQRVTEAGEWVNPGSGLVELVATDRVRFDFRVSQSYFSQIDKDTKVELTLDAFPKIVIDSRVQAVVPVSDPGARTFLLRVVANLDELPDVTPGMSARARLHIDAGRRAVAAPRDALLLHPDGRKTVWVARESGDAVTVHERSVETGVEFDGLVEIRQGLQAGENVVTRGNEALQDGQSVSVR